MKQVIQLDHAGYFAGLTTADESPLEPGVLLIPGGCIEATAPTIPEGQRAKWEGAWVFEDILQQEPTPAPEPVDPTVVRIAELRGLLASTDYKVLPDYDNTTEEIKAQRQAWRVEIRALEGTQP